MANRKTATGFDLTMSLKTPVKNLASPQMLILLLGEGDLMSESRLSRIWPNKKVVLIVKLVLIVKSKVPNV